MTAATTEVEGLNVSDVSAASASNKITLQVSKY